MNKNKYKGNKPKWILNNQIVLVSFFEILLVNQIQLHEIINYLRKYSEMQSS